MLEKIPMDKVLFLDIETVPQTYNYQDLDSKTRELFDMKTQPARKCYSILKKSFKIF